ncbi:MAG: hypothetical protein KDA52_09815, partial [Planctomycetaceae bacterium]|nr:hypothetical protein [Planctomycetaceae bacterium]
MGVISAALVFSVAASIERKTGFNLEATVGLLGIAGLGLTGTGLLTESRSLAGIGLLLWGWMALLPIGVIGMLCWMCLSIVREIFRSKQK